MKKLAYILVYFCALTMSAQNSDIQKEMNLRNYEKALSLMNHNQVDMSLISLKIQALKGLNRYREAISLLSEVKLKDPDNLQWDILLGECYRADGNLRKASEAYNAVLKKNPEHTYARLQLISCLHSAGDYFEM